MPILVFSPNGTYTQKLTLDEARTASDCAGKTVVVTSALMQAQSNILAAWPSDRALKVEKGGSIANSTAFTFTTGDLFEAGLYQVFTGAGAVTGLGKAYPEWWGGLGDDSTDNTTVFSKIVTAGSSVVILQYGGVYRVAGTASTAIMSLSSLKAFSLVGGAEIKDTTTYTSGQIARFAEFTACNNIFIDPSIKFTSMVSGTNSYGMEFLKFLQGCDGVRGGGEFVGGIAGFYFQQSTPINSAYISKNLDLTIKATNTFYPSLHERSGNNGQVRINATGAGRSWFGFGGGSGLDVTVESKNQTGSTVISSDSGGTGVHDTVLRFRDRDSTSHGSSAPAVYLQFYNQAASEMKNIRVELDVKNTESAPFYSSFEIWKLNNSAAADTVGRGHILNGLVVTGISEQVNNRNHIGMVGSFASTDSVSNISIENLSGITTAGSSISASKISLTLGDALAGILNVRNVTLDLDNAMAITNSTGKVLYSGCKMYDGTASTTDASVQDYHSCEIVNGSLQSYLNKSFLNTSINNVIRNSFNGFGSDYSTTRGNTTAYTLGITALWTSGTTVWVCTTAGSTAGSPPSISGKIVGDTVVDDTVTWQMKALR